MPVALERCERFDDSLFEQGPGDGCHGFRFALHPDLVAGARLASVEIANLPGGPRRSVDLLDAPFEPSPSPAGGVEWLGGLRLGGWVRRPADGATPLVEAYVDGERVAFARADRWREIGDGAAPRVEPAFLLTLPRFLADGSARHVELRHCGRQLPGSPVALVAFADALEADLLSRADLRDEAARGQLFDLACPDAVPFERFASFDARFFPVSATQRLGKPVALAVIGEETRGRETLAGPALKADGSWTGATLSSEDGPTSFGANDLVRFLEGAGAPSPVVVFLAAGAALRPGALARLASALENDPAADIAYGDLLLRMEDGTLHPLMLPAFDEERFLEQGSAALAFAMRRGAALKAARRGVTELFRLFLAPLENGAGRGTHLHVPGAGIVLAAPDPAVLGPVLQAATLAHFAERGIRADVDLRAEAVLPAVRMRRRMAARPATTIVVDACGPDGPAEIGPCLEALEATRMRTGAGILLVTAPLSEERRRAFELDGVPVLEALPRESRAARLGRAAERAETPQLCFLDPGLRPLAPDWLDELTGRLAEPLTGAVGPTIHSAGGLVAQAGLVLRPAGRHARAFLDRRAEDAGYGDVLRVARQVSALSGACLLTTRTAFLAAGGFDPQLFPEDGGDIDFCLKLRALGRRLVVTPDACLERAGSAVRPEGEPRRRLRERAERLLFARWPEAFACDPFYNPQLDRGPVPYSGLAWPPGAIRARRPTVAQPRHLPPGW